MSYLNRTMIVPAAHQQLAASLSEGLAGAGGSAMFQTPLSASGSFPATHYISAGMIEEEFANLLTSAESIFARCQAAGVDVPLATIQAMLAASTISEDPPFTVLEALNLKLVTEESI